VTATLPTPTAHDLEQARRLAGEGPPAESVGLDPYPTAGRGVDLGSTIRMRGAAR
jgi:nitrate reductase molybdenum cofactor assembly chaperone NarJ/NarW